MFAGLVDLTYPRSLSFAERGENVGSNVRGSEPRRSMPRITSSARFSEILGSRLSLVAAASAASVGNRYDAPVQVGAPLGAQSNVVASGRVTPGACCFYNGIVRGESDLSRLFPCRPPRSPLGSSAAVSVAGILLGEAAAFPFAAKSTVQP